MGNMVPVPMLRFRRWTLEESMWIPSVLGLSAGARIVNPSTRTLSLESMVIWNRLLSMEVKSLTTVLLVLTNRKDCPLSFHNVKIVLMINSLHYMFLIVQHLNYCVKKGVKNLPQAQICTAPKTMYSISIKYEDVYPNHYEISVKYEDVYPNHYETMQDSSVQMVILHLRFYTCSTRRLLVHPRILHHSQLDHLPS